MQDGTVSPRPQGGSNPRLRIDNPAPYHWAMKASLALGGFDPPATRFRVLFRLSYSANYVLAVPRGRSLPTGSYPSSNFVPPR